MIGREPGRLGIGVDRLAVAAQLVEGATLRVVRLAARGIGLECFIKRVEGFGRLAAFQKDMAGLNLVGRHLLVFLAGLPLLAAAHPLTAEIPAN